MNIRPPAKTFEIALRRSRGLTERQRSHLQMVRLRGRKLQRLRKLFRFKNLLAEVAPYAQALIEKLKQPSSGKTFSKSESESRKQKAKYIASLFSQNKGKVIEALGRLGQFKAREAIQFMRCFLYHPDHEIRLRAISAFGDFGLRAAIPYIRPRTRDSSVKVRESARSWVKTLEKSGL